MGGSVLKGMLWGTVASLAVLTTVSAVSPPPVPRDLLSAVAATPEIIPGHGAGVTATPERDAVSAASVQSDLADVSDAPAPADVASAVQGDGANHEVAALRPSVDSATATAVESEAKPASAGERAEEKDTSTGETAPIGATGSSVTTAVGSETALVPQPEPADVASVDQVSGSDGTRAQTSSSNLSIAETSNTAGIEITRSLVVAALEPEAPARASAEATPDGRPSGGAIAERLLSEPGSPQSARPVTAAGTTPVPTEGLAAAEVAASPEPFTSKVSTPVGLGSDARQRVAAAPSLTGIMSDAMVPATQAGVASAPQTPTEAAPGVGRGAEATLARVASESFQDQTEPSTLASRSAPDSVERVPAAEETEAVEGAETVGSTPVSGLAEAPLAVAQTRRAPASGQADVLAPSSAGELAAAGADASLEGTVIPTPIGVQALRPGDLGVRQAQASDQGQGLPETVLAQAEASSDQDTNGTVPLGGRAPALSDRGGTIRINRPSTLPAPAPNIGADSNTVETEEGTAEADMPSVPEARRISVGAPAPGRTVPEVAEAAEEGVSDAPALVRNARPFTPPPDGRPLIAVVLLDTAPSGVGPQAVSDLGFPLAFGVDPRDPGAANVALRYRDLGQEVLLFGAGLPDGATPQDAEVTLAAHFAAIPSASGLISRETGGFLEDRALTEQVLQILADEGQGLLLWDRGLNRAMSAAERSGQPAALISRRIDDRGAGTSEILRRLDRAAFEARRTGQVIVVGENRPETVRALAGWHAALRQDDPVLAPVSAILRASSDEAG